MNRRRLVRGIMLFIGFFIFFILALVLIFYIRLNSV